MSGFLSGRNFAIRTAHKLTLLPLHTLPPENKFRGSFEEALERVHFPIITRTLYLRLWHADELDSAFGKQ